jgi:hypothetical protein
MMPSWFNAQQPGFAMPALQGQPAQEQKATGIQGLDKAAGKDSDKNKDSFGQELSEEDQRRVQELKKIDTNVKAHEAAHMSAGGGLVRGGASYEYQSGPDGQRYAVAGEVSIDTSPIKGDPQATLAKAQRIRQAALAPADPSSQDRSVAAQAGQMAAEASMELAKQSREAGQSAQGPANQGLADQDPGAQRPFDQSPTQQPPANQASPFQTGSTNSQGRTDAQQQRLFGYLINSGQHHGKAPGSLLHLSA